MIARRARLVAALVLLLSMLSMGTAHAAGTGRITSPSSGASVTSPVAVTIEVTGDAGSVFNPRDHEVQVRLADHTGAAAYGGTRTVTATCSANCDSDSTWTTSTFDPATLAPFGSAPSCNGGYTVQVQVDGGPWTGNAIRISRPPAAPSGVAVSVEDGDATVTWNGAATPDTVGYAVERRADGGSWQEVARVGTGARSATDTSVAPGEVEYRVATLRGDGLVAGRGVAPCSDTEPDLATPSAPVGATVRDTSSAPAAPARPSPSSSPSPDDTASDGPATGGTSSGGSDGDGTAADDGRTTDGSGAPAADGDGTSTDGTDGEGADGDGSSTPTRRPGNRVAPPSRVETMNAPTVDDFSTPAADGPQVATDEEHYYGEGEGYSEALDFSGADDGLGDVDALGPGPARTRIIRVPGALQAVLGEELALDRILAPVAAGLILLAFGLHLRRWTREGLEQ